LDSERKEKELMKWEGLVAVSQNLRFGSELSPSFFCWSSPIGIWATWPLGIRARFLPV
jgi:hypothetical protein